MKTTLLFSAALIATNLSAQTYQQITGTPFTTGANPSIEFFDKDGDGDKDVMICAYDHTVSAPFSRLYENDGLGNFTLVTGPFEGIHLGDLAIGDIDGDNDLDMIIIGKNSSENSTTKVYLNNGSGVYTIKPGTGLPNIGAGCAELGDLDGDGDLDLYIDGSTTAAYPFVNYTGLFVNDGNGNFTQNTSNTFLSRFQSTKLVDLDNDGYLDIVASGYSNGVGSGTDFYKNNGGMNFNAAVAISTYGGEIGLIDVNNDNAMDLFIGGTDNTSSTKAVDVFINNGSASFTKVSGNSFGEYNDIYCTINDFDADGDKDIILVGWENVGGGHVAKQFLNNGSGVFTENTGASFTGVRNGNVISTDVNGNGKLEILIVGYTNSGNIANLYEEEPACNVSIPDANFKAYLVGNSAINTNGNTEIECSEATAYTGTINCSSSNISDMTGIEAFTGLTFLDCSENTITTLDLSVNTALENIYCEDNAITSLTLGSNSALLNLYCNTNQLTALNVSQCPSITNVSCYENNLTALDVTQNTALTDLNCRTNSLTNLDVSGNSNLKFLVAMINNLSSLNVANGNNANFTGFYANQNPNLTCIEVDDAQWSTTNWNNIDSQTAFSEDCATLGIEESNVITSVYPNPTIGLVTFNASEKIQTIELYNITGQKVANFRNVNTINISHLPCGIYTATIQTKSGKTALKKLVKE